MVICYTDQTLNPNPFFTSKNLLLGVRIGNNPGKLGRVEFGIEYQYSIADGYRFELKEENRSTSFTSDHRFLVLGLYYFIFNREL